MKTTVIYHSADFDGLFCREIARKFLPDAEMIGWNFGDAPLELKGSQPTDRIIVMDLPLDAPFGLKMHPGAGDNQATGFPDTLVWIDHHASSIASHPKNIIGYRIDGVAACRLAWQWFKYQNECEDKTRYVLPIKSDFVDRHVSEPLAVRLAGEYDIWDKRDPRAELFQHGLRSRELTPDIWEMLLVKTQEVDGKQDIGTILVEALLESGEAIQYAQTQQNESIIKAAGFTIQFEGLTFLACNHARYNSFLFTAGLTPEHDGCFGFAWRDGKWNVSLYHAPGKEQHDLSLIAVKYGGGGHRGACGFQMDKLPFLEKERTDK